MKEFKFGDKVMYRDDVKAIFLELCKDRRSAYIVFLDENEIFKTRWDLVIRSELHRGWKK